MTNNLRQVSQDLRAFAKRTKDFKYTDSALITFLMTGMVSITSNLFSATTDKSIENQKQEISSSIKGMHQKVKETRRENDKLLKNTNLELIQLMEQGDHVVKSPWSSWQYGINYFNNNWNGTYKGKGDKKAKYPYEGIFQRSLNVYERTISPDSDKYSLFSKTRNPKSATGLSGNYGIASTKPVKEPIVGFEVNAGITPRQVQKGAITIPAKQATTPQTPTPVNFSPVAPNVPTINTVPVNITAVALNAFWNAQEQTVLARNLTTVSDGVYNLTGANDEAWCKTHPTPYCGANGDNPNYKAHAILEITKAGNYGIGTGVTFNVNASGERALSFDPIESSSGESKFTNEGKINLNATNTAGMELTTQENGVNVTGINKGTIKGEFDRQSAFTFTQEQNPTGIYTAINETGGTINLTGNTSTGFGFYVKSPGWVVKAINKGNVTMAGNTSYGIGLSTKATLPGGGTANNNVAAGSVFQNASGGIMNISGDNSGGIAVQKQADPSRALTVENSSGGTINVSGENSFGMYSELHQNVTNAGDINITGSKNNSIGLRNNNIDNDANSSMTNTGNINISSTGNTNIGLYTSNGTVINTGKVNVTAGKNVGMVVYGTGKGKNESGAEINVTSSDVSQGVVTKGTGSFTNKGKITLNSAGNGSVGVIVGNATPMESGTLDSTNGEIDITVTGNKSIGTFSNGNLTLGKTNVVANDGSVNFFEGKNTSSTTTFAAGKNSTAKTGQGSLLFYSDGGKFNIAGKLTADVAGGSDVNSRGTAFYYTAPSHYASFNSGDITTWANNIFNGSLKNLTLNMNKGSRLFVASDVGMNLSDTTGDSVSKATGANIQGAGYKTFMLYKSKLTINQNVNLDDDNDALNQLEIANSSIDNNNSQTITGTKTGLVALAQENKAHTNRADVTINNYGTVNLSGAKSTGMYAKYGILNNDTTGKITMGDSSTAIYGKDDSIVTNKGAVTIGSNSTGLYSEDTDQAITNDGTITSSGNNSIGVSYKPKAISAAGTDMLKNTGTITMTGDKNVGLYATEGAAATYNVLNAGTITMGDSASLSNPNVAIYTDNANHTLTNGGTVTVGKNSIGLYGYTSNNSGNVTVGNGGIGIYSQGGNVNLTGGTITTGSNEAVGVYTVGSGQNITNNGTTFNLGDNSFGFVNVGSGNTITSTISNIGLGNNSVYVYSNDTKGTVTNNTAISSTGNQNYGLYSAGTVNNNATINLSNGKGNVGIYSVGGGTATNNSSIIVGESDSKNNLFSIGMGAGYGTTDRGTIINKGTITVNGKDSIGMYASGSGSQAINDTGSTITLNADNTTGIYADNGATAINRGTITTSGSHSKVVGVYLGKGATLNNTGTIHIDSDNGTGIYLKGGIVANYGTITVAGGAKREAEFTTPPTGKEVGGVSIDAPAGATSATITVNGVPQTPTVVNTTGKNPITVSASSIGLYINTSGVNITKSIDGLNKLTNKADLIVGTEATEVTNSKYILVNDPNIINPYKQAMLQNNNIKWNIYSGSLTWMATPTLDRSNGSINSLYMAKIPYTAWAGRESTPVNSADTYHFTDGLEQRYGVKALGTRERLLFQKLNGIGNNEEVLLYQAFDEMMGHQYGNLQQRINATGNLLDKEFRYLKHDWRNPSKQNNKIKVFGMRDEYNTDTAGIINYTSNAYGVAYVHEDEKIKMGNSSGWYAGAVTNRFKFKDIGKSKENQTILKAGVFKTMSPKKDYNGALQWTIGGDVFVGINDMKRRYLVVDDVFQAKSDYHSYGAALKTDLGYDVRLSERTHFRPYGALKMEYGRFNDIKEDRGEMRLEVKGNDYFSVKPEVGMEFKYVQPLAVRTNLTVGLTAAYENELGKVGDVNNRGRVRYTSADWFGIRGEKDDRKGNGKFDLNIGVDNTRFGVTVNGGYDTKGKNVRAGIGFRAIY